MKYTDTSHMRKKNIANRLKRIAQYNLNPKLCKECNKPLPYENHNLKQFCNCSCSISYSNKHRNKKSQQTKVCLFCGKPIPSTRKYCTPKCWGLYTIKTHLENGEGVSKSKLRLYLIYLRGHACEECHRTTWNNLPIPLETHHINGKYNDNRLENLQLDCPNCHALTDNYKAKNKGNGRPYSKYR